MTIESIEIIFKALDFYRQQKVKYLEEAKSERLLKQTQKGSYVAESLEVSKARAELEKVSTALNEFGSLRAAQINNPPPEKSDDRMPKAVRIWIAYLRDQYSTAIPSDEDFDVLRKLQTIF